MSKGMSNIHLKVTIGKNCCSQIFDFLFLKILSPGQFLEASNSPRYYGILKIPVVTQKLKFWKEKYV